MKLMTRGLALVAAIAALAAVATPAQASQPSAASDLLDAFGHHRIVALGQVHDLRQDDFIPADRILTGRPFVLPPSVPTDVPYCPTAGGEEQQ